MTAGNVDAETLTCRALNNNKISEGYSFHACKINF